jgi:hypothetical protein
VPLPGKDCAVFEQNECCVAPAPRSSSRLRYAPKPVVGRSSLSTSPPYFNKLHRNPRGLHQSRSGSKRRGPSCKIPPFPAACHTSYRPLVVASDIITGHNIIANSHTQSVAQKWTFVSDCPGRQGLQVHPQEATKCTKGASSAAGRDAPSCASGLPYSNLSVKWSKVVSSTRRSCSKTACTDTGSSLEDLIVGCKELTFGEAPQAGHSCDPPLSQYSAPELGNAKIVPEAPSKCVTRAGRTVGSASGSHNVNSEDCQVVSVTCADRRASSSFGSGSFHGVTNALFESKFVSTGDFDASGDDRVQVRSLKESTSSLRGERALHESEEKVDSVVGVPAHALARMAAKFERCS